MIDIEIVRKETGAVAGALKNRQMDSEMANNLKKLDDKWKSIKMELDALRASKNQATSKISDAKKSGKDITPILEESRKITKSMEELEQKEKDVAAEREGLWLIIPNMPDKSVPIGKDEKDNKEIKKWGKIAKESSDVLAHYDLGIREGVLDFDRGAKLSGHRFTVMSGWANKLERALISFMLDMHTMNGYREMWVPDMVKEEMMVGTGQLPKFREEFYTTEDEGNRLCLIPTAEVPLTNLHNGEILEEIELPKKYVAYTPCFRKEAGSYGKDIKGILRQHQFDKVEMVKITTPETSWKELESMLADAEIEVCKSLVIPDEKDQIKEAIIKYADVENFDLILTTGGTGVSPRDVTPDATLEVIDKQIPGMAEAMRHQSMNITPYAMISRAIAGIRGHCLIVNLPGSPKGAKENLAIIMPALKHAIEKIKGDNTECAAP